MTLHGGLDTNAAPSWKPLPWVFTRRVRAVRARRRALAVDGDGHVRLARRAGVGGARLGTGAGAGAGASAARGRGGAGAGRKSQPADPIAAAGKVVRAEAESLPRIGRASRAARRRLAGAVAALLAVLVLLAVHDQYPFGYLHYVLSSQSDPMIVAFVLGAADCRRRDRPGGAFGLLLRRRSGGPRRGRSCSRPASGCGARGRGARWAVVAGLCGGRGAVVRRARRSRSRSWFVAADNAGASGYAPHGDALHRAITVLARFVFQLPWAIWAAAAGAVAARGVAAGASGARARGRGRSSGSRSRSASASTAGRRSGATCSSRRRW